MKPTVLCSPPTAASGFRARHSHRRPRVLYSSQWDGRRGLHTSKLRSRGSPGCPTSPAWDTFFSGPQAIRQERDGAGAPPALPAGAWSEPRLASQPSSGCRRPSGSRPPSRPCPSPPSEPPAHCAHLTCAERLRAIRWPRVL